MKSKFLSFALIVLAMIHRLQACPIGYNSTVFSQSGQIDCAHSDGCMIRIAPNRRQSIQLSIESFGNSHKLWIYSTFERGTMLLKNFHDTKTAKSYLAGPNEGFVLDTHGSKCIATFTKYSFNRVPADRMVCDEMFNVIGSKVRVLQSPRSSKIVENCAYFLKAENVSNSETLYLLSEKEMIVQTNHRDKSFGELTGKYITVRDWTSVHFTMADGSKEKIIVASTKRSCSCWKKQIILAPEKSLEIQSPGYPDFLCPAIRCSTSVIVPQSELPHHSEQYVTRLLVSIKARSQYKCSLHLKSNSLDLLLDRDSFTTLSTSFLLKEEHFNITFSTPYYLSIGDRGHYKMLIKRVHLRKECDCSTLLQRTYETDKNIKFVIPSHCEMVYCDWTIKPSVNATERLKTIESFITNGNIHDEIHIWNKNVMERYDNKLFKYPRMTLIENTSDTHISFWRLSRRANTEVALSWRTIDDSLCQLDTNVSITTSHQTFVSPNYPHHYFSKAQCSTTFIAPENHFVRFYLADMDIHYLHDYLDLFDGSSSASPLIKQITGKQEGLTITSSGHFMRVQFFAGGQYAGRGFHYTILAVPMSSRRPQQKKDVSPPSPNRNQLSLNYKSKPEETYDIWHIILTILISSLLASTITTVVILGYQRIKRKEPRVSRNSTSTMSTIARNPSEDHDVTTDMESETEML